MKDWGFVIASALLLVAATMFTVSVLAH